MPMQQRMLHHHGTCPHAQTTHFAWFLQRLVSQQLGLPAYCRECKLPSKTCTVLHLCLWLSPLQDFTRSSAACVLPRLHVCPHRHALPLVLAYGCLCHIILLSGPDSLRHPMRLYLSCYRLGHGIRLQRTLHASAAGEERCGYGACFLMCPRAP